MMNTLEELFPGYYAPTKDGFSSLWKDGLFVLDSNVLLDLYMVPDQTRRQALDALSKLKQRLWLPYQSALEFQRLRIKMIGDGRIKVAKAVEPLEEALAKFEAAVASVELEKRGLTKAAADMTDLLSKGKGIIAAAQDALNSQVDLVGEDPIRDAVSELFAGRIGDAPDEKTLEGWYKDAVERYKHRMGPGCEDDDKKNPTFLHNGVLYNKHYGDFVIWQQTIQIAKDAEIKGVVMLTQERKIDWMSKHERRTAGPQPEISAEIRKEAQIDTFWVYNLEEFLQEARTRLNAEVSDRTLHDLADVRISLPAAAEVERLEWSGTDFANWLISRGVSAKIRGGRYAAGPADRGHWYLAIDSGGIGYVKAEKQFVEIVRKCQELGAVSMEVFWLLNTEEREGPSEKIKLFMEEVKKIGDLSGIRVTYYAGAPNRDYELLGRVVL